MPELALDDDQWHTLVRHLDRVRVTELTRREPTAHSRVRRGARQLLARRTGLPVTTSSRAADHAQQRADRQLAPDGEPRLQLGPGPAIHPDLATPATLT